MKKSVVFQIGMKAFLPLLLIGSVLIFWRGHQLPGGGFIGGLVAGSTLAAHAFCFGSEATRKFVRFHPLWFVIVGLFFALVSGIISAFAGVDPFTGLWIKTPLLGDLGTPLLFDLGVYSLVIGFVLVFITETLREDP